jgi:inhibitor of KinA sporulation pathway (predicted exonuclease)
MLEHLELDFEGRPHCGLDDARNIARVLLQMIRDGASIQVNERIYPLALEENSKVSSQVGLLYELFILFVRRETQGQNNT